MAFGSAKERRVTRIYSLKRSVCVPILSKTIRDFSVPQRMRSRPVSVASKVRFVVPAGTAVSNGRLFRNSSYVEKRVMA